MTALIRVKRWFRRLLGYRENKVFPSLKKIAKVHADGRITVDLSDMPVLKNGDTASFEYQWPRT